MKKFILFALALLSVATVSSQKKDFSRWSVLAEYGYDNFDGDVKQDATSISRGAVGATVEYAFTPIWGLSADFHYFPLHAICDFVSPIADINTKLYTPNINATINLTKLIFPKSESKITINVAGGIGFAYYKFNTVPPSLMKATSNTSVSVPIAFLLEYNFSKPYACGLKVDYRTYTNDDLEGLKWPNRYHGVTNDHISAVTLFFRYKFDAVEKDHLRNISEDAYAPDSALILAKATAAKLNKLDTTVQKLSNKVDGQGARLDSVVVLLSNDGPDADGDGVPDQRDMGENTPPNTPVDFWGRPINYLSNNGLNGTNGTNGLNGKDATNATYSNTVILSDDVPAVYFDFDQIGLDNDALITISKIAAKLKKEPTVVVEVRGYCDYTGNTPYNETLSKRRADRVKAELVKMWKISPERIIPNGKGKIIEPRAQYRPNRRCDFFFSK